MLRFSLYLLFVVLLLPACRKSDFIIENTQTITDLGGGTGTTTWTRDQHYLINGFVFVNDGQILTIESGTVIRAKTGQGSQASALIVARGGKIIAEGTQTDPIIFTVEGDDLKGSVPVEARGLWGGLIILGNAEVNTSSGEDFIEGIPISEPRGVYGGIDEDDNSGILNYVSIRHGGTNIGEGNEINGLTLGGVGRKTIIDHVEVISNADDGVEVFGGTVDCKNMVVSFCGDDAFDFDQGYKGKMQFILALNAQNSDRCVECSAGLLPLQTLPNSMPLIYNATFFGKTADPIKPEIHFSDYAGGHILNSIFINSGTGIAIKYSDRPGDSYSLFQSRHLDLKNNILYPSSGNFPTLFCYTDDNQDLSAENSILGDSLVNWLNTFEDPGIYSNSNGYKLLPPSTEFENMATYDYEWFEKVTYKGAFGSRNWLEIWTLLYQEGYLID